MKVTKPNLPALFVGVWVFTLISGQVVAQTHEANFLTPDVSDSATVRVEEDALGNADSLWWAWCAEAHCMSTDSAVWFAGMSSQERGRNLDTANIVLALSDLGFGGL